MLPIKRTARQRLETFASISRIQTDEEMYDIERSVVGSVAAGTTADRCGRCGACDRTVAPVAVGDRETGDMAVKDKPHGPVSEHFMRHYYGASKPAPTPHPDSHGHWDHAQISELLYERDALRELLREAFYALNSNEATCLDFNDLRGRIDAALGGKEEGCV